MLNLNKKKFIRIAIAVLLSILGVPAAHNIITHELATSEVAK